MTVTYLFVPGDRPDRFAKAFASGADRVILDLEDAVRADAKPAARAAIAAADVDWSRTVVRVNDAASPFFDDDRAALASIPAAAILLPKAETVESITRVVEAASRDVNVIPQIETVRGLDRLADMLAVPCVDRAAFGHLDFALDLGAEPEWEALLLARSTLVMQSRLAEAEPPIDSVSPAIRDLDALRREAAAARNLGFGAKLLIHPAQVGPVAQAFAPSDEDVAWARKVLEAVASGAAGAVSLDGRMIDKPVEDAARRILARTGDAGA